jgi:outer membrane protein
MLVARHLPASAVALALGFGTAAASAQSLLELYDAAHAFDATYLSARALAESVPYRIEQTEALLRPSASLGSSAARVQTDPAVGPGYPSNTVTVSLSARQPVFNRANVATVQQAEKSLDVSRADLDTAEQELILRLSQAYFDVLAAQDTLGTTRTNKAAISEQLASAKRNFEVGTATITDTREAQARYDLATAQEIAAENDLVTKRIALDQVVGRRNVVPRQLATPVALPALVPDNPEAWVDVAEGRHPAIRRARVALDIARLETAKARAAALPTVDAVASVGTGRGAIGGSFGSQVGTNSSASIGLQLNMPLYSGGAIQNRIKETLVLEDRSQNDLEAARRSVAQTTRQAFYTLLSGAAQVRALEAAESSSQLALEATQLGYRVGVRVNLDVLNAQTQLFQTRRDLARARYDVLVGNLRLRQAAGVVSGQDVAAVDRLLAR